MRDDVEALTLMAEEISLLRDLSELDPGPSLRRSYV